MPNSWTEGDVVFWAAVRHQGHSRLAEDGKEGKAFSCYNALVTATSHVNIVNKDIMSLHCAHVDFFSSLS